MTHADFNPPLKDKTPNSQNKSMSEKFDVEDIGKLKGLESLFDKLDFDFDSLPPEKQQEFEFIKRNIQYYSRIEFPES